MLLFLYFLIRCYFFLIAFLQFFVILTQKYPFLLFSTLKIAQILLLLFHFLSLHLQINFVRVPLNYKFLFRKKKKKKNFF